MKKAFVVLVLTVCFGAGAHIAFAAVPCSVDYTLGDPFNHVDFVLHADVPDGTWLTVDFGDGPPFPDVPMTGGIGTTNHDYNYLGGSFILVVTGEAECDTTVQVVQNSGNSSSGGQAPFVPPVVYADVWCEAVTLNQSGNHVVLKGRALNSGTHSLFVDWGDGRSVFPTVYGELFVTDHDYALGDWDITIMPNGSPSPCFSQKVVVGEGAKVESLVCEFAPYHEADTQLVVNSRCSWVAFVRNGSLWAGKVDGTRAWQVTFDGQPIAASNLTVSRRGVIGFVGPDGQHHETDRYGSFMR